MRQLLLYIIFFIFSWANIVQAQYHITYYQKSDGLPANLTKTTIQDKHGFIWFGTDLGLVRFDGKNFEKRLEGLPSPYIKSFIKTREGELVAVTDGGLLSLISEPDSIGFKPFHPISPNDSIPFNYPRGAFNACDGSLWISESEQVSHLKGQGHLQYKFENAAPVNYVRSIMFWEQGCGEIYAAIPTGRFATYSSDEEDFIPLSIQVGSGIKLTAFDNDGFVPFHGILQASNGRIIVASGIGLLTFRIDPIEKKATLEEWNLRGVAMSHVIEAKNGKVYASSFNNGVYHAKDINSLHRAEAIGGLPFHVTKYLYEDHDGNIWVNGDGGVILLHPQFFRTIPIPENMRVYNYAIGEDGQSYLVNDRHELLRAIRKDENWDWVLSATKADVPSGGTLFTEHSMMVIYQDTLFRTDTVSQSIRATSKHKVTRMPFEDAPAGGFVKRDKYGNLWLTQDEASWMRKPNGKIKRFTSPIGDNDSSYVFIGQNGQEVYMTRISRHQNYLFQFDHETEEFVDISAGAPIPDSLGIIGSHTIDFIITDAVKDWQGNYWLTTGRGLFQISDGKFKSVSLGQEFDNQPINMLLPDNQGGIWLAMNVALLYYKNGEIHEFSESDGLPITKVFPEGLRLSPDGTLWVATPLGICYTQSSALNAQDTPKPVFTNIRVNGEKASLSSKEPLPYLSFIEIAYTAPTYPSEKVQFRYRVNHGENTEWSPVSLNENILLPQLHAGLHQLEIQAKQQGNYNWSTSQKITFHVLPIWYATWWGISSLLLVLALIIFISIKIYSIRLKKKQVELQRLVNERTEEINIQKEEIMQQRDNLQALHSDLVNSLDAIQIQQKINEQKTKNITDSINYASRIQLAMLPSEARMKNLLPNHFVFYKPRDIVSGDFYWCNAIDEHRTILVVADCTGHGVPGAFMSLIGMVMLEQIVFIKDIHQPDKILEALNNDIQKTLKQEDSSKKSRDGMDISICVIDKQNRSLQFAGAKSQLLFIQKEKGYRIKGDNKSVGGEYSPVGTTYTLSEFDLTHIDAFYLLSDGYQDQFGGPFGKKFMSANFRKMTVAMHHHSPNEQLRHLEKTLNDWMNPENGQYHPQIDDILVIGVDTTNL